MQQAIFKCTISIAIEISSLLKNNCEAGCRKMPLQRLEPYGSKDPCTVLRGLGAGNRVQLPDSHGTR